MKNFSKIIIVIETIVIVLLAGALGMRSCGGADSPVDDSSVETDQDPADLICYYGCPNSRRVKKLNLRKSRRVL